MLGMNVASQMSVTVRALRRIGIEADGVVADGNPFFSPDGLRNLAHGLRRSQRLRVGFLRTSWSYSVISSIVAADVVHWNYGLPALEHGLDVRLAGLLRRRSVVEFWGSDVRVATLAAETSPYYARRGPGYEYERQETLEGSYRRQRLFARHGVRACLAPPWFDRYVEPGLFDEFHESFPRLLLDEFPPRPVDRDRVPVVAHAPSARNAKGTDAVLAAVERLKEHHAFEFVLLHGLPRQQVLEAVRDCDVFLDQFVIGEYGMASIEAMAFGKPTVCYLRPDVVARSPGRIPIVNATPDDLSERLGELLEDPARRRALGAESRRYVEQHHDAIAHAHRFAALYRRLAAGAGTARDLKARRARA